MKMEQSNPPALVRLSEGLGPMLIVAAMLAGCGMQVDNKSLDWTPQQKEEWVQKARAECKPHGHALDSASGGYTVMREVLVCPDGTLRIVPLR
jgi:hypothetical protein